ncbi:O-antigen ligase [Tepidiforma thermophila]|uniref:O-antigen ligase n=2 Tax=Tepidiforma thermophila (strain KCTC 52669 / CGMCC 1.13589 / G233) TaxID=2761530 RepID=A0A2A9HHN0_TEPT2|nr:O-antigen ligase [Tepidiforma thermophila]
MATALGGVPSVFWPALYDDFTLPKQALLAATGGATVAGFLWGGWRRTMPGWLQGVLGGWLAVVVAAAAAGLDWRGSVFGYYQYRQGIVTQFACAALFAGGWALAASGRWRVFGAGFAGLAAAFAYTAVQAAGKDPFDWWIDTSDRAIGTIGNANELAAFAVISMGLVAFVPARRFAAGAAASWAAALFIVLEAESRSGLAAVLLFFVLVPVARWIAGEAGRPLLRAAPVIGLALGLVTVASLAAGGLEGTAARVSGQATRAETGGSTRLALWEGTLHVIAARPLLGTGPDGLHLGFPRWRPADLGGAYEEYDLIAQSSHNSVLDTAATTGLAGLALLLALVGGCAAASIRAVRRARGGPGPDWPYAWAAMAAYGALTLLNPISLAAHALFFAMLGAMGAAAMARPVQRRPSSWGFLAGVPAAAAGVVIAVALPAADLRAQAGWDAFAGGEFARAAERYEAAARINPFERDYARRETVALVAAASVDPGRLGDAERALRRFDRRFGFGAGDAFNLAAVLVAMGRPPEEVLPVVQRAVALNPHGVATAWYAGQLVQAVHDGGVLVFDETDRWTYVVPLPSIAEEGLP